MTSKNLNPAIVCFPVVMVGLTIPVRSIWRRIIPIMRCWDRIGIWRKHKMLRYPSFFLHTGWTRLRIVIMKFPPNFPGSSLVNIDRSRFPSETHPRLTYAVWSGHFCPLGQRLGRPDRVVPEEVGAAPVASVTCATAGWAVLCSHDFHGSHTH